MALALSVAAQPAQALAMMLQGRRAAAVGISRPCPLSIWARKLGRCTAVLKYCLLSTRHSAQGLRACRMPQQCGSMRSRVLTAASLALVCLPHVGWSTAWLPRLRPALMQGRICMQSPRQVPHLSTATHARLCLEIHVHVMCRPQGPEDAQARQQAADAVRRLTSISEYVQFTNTSFAAHAATYGCNAEDQCSLSLVAAYVSAFGCDKLSPVPCC